MKRLLSVLILSALLPLLSATEVSSEKETEAEQRRAIVYELFQAQGMPAQLEQISQAMVQSQLKDQPKLAKYYPSLLAFYRKCSGYDAVKQELADLYLKHFTVDEIRQMTEFYRSPVGQKMKKISAQILIESTAISEKHIQENLPAFLAEVEKLLREEEKK